MHVRATSSSCYARAASLRARSAAAPVRASAAARDQPPFSSASSSSSTSKLARGPRNRTTAAARRRVERRLRRAQQELLLEMPLAGRQGLWLLDRDLLPDPLYGEGFVLRRAEAEWCLSAEGDGRPQQQQAAPPAAAARPLTALPPASPRKLLPYQRECLALVSVPVSDDEAAQLGIVPWQDPQQQQQQSADGDASDAAMHAFLFGNGASSSSSSSSSSASTWDPSKAALDAPTESSSPRRTSRIRFTCRRCGATTQRAVNPHAWRRGTVFATCGGCGVTHKLVDNLRLFHELDGPVFNGAGSAAAGAPPAIAWQPEQGEKQGPEEQQQQPAPIISTDFRAGRWAADGELGLPLGLRWLVEDDGGADAGQV
jgi:hypothetical protein